MLISLTATLALAEAPALVWLSPTQRALLAAVLAQAGPSWFTERDNQSLDLAQALVSGVAEAVMRGMPGVIIWYAGSAPPPGTLLCDGAVYSQADYPMLYEVLEAFRLPGGQFRVPDLLGRVPRGGGEGEVGETGGEHTHTLTQAEMPAHAHVIGGAATITAVGPGELLVLAPGLPGETGPAGGGMPHENWPPFIVLLPCITY